MVSDNLALPPGPFDVVVADPPWKYQKDAGAKRSADEVPMSGRGGQAEGRYDTMTNEEIAALPVRDVVADDAHLFLWITNPGIYGGRFSDVTPAQIAEAWGFQFKTLITWVKTTNDGAVMRGGMGWYFRGCTEHVLYAVRGKAGIPPALREPNVVMAPRGAHSAKPWEFAAMVERVVPDARRLEMFARHPRAGWETWGNQADADAKAANATPSAVAGLHERVAGGLW